MRKPLLFLAFVMFASEIRAQFCPPFCVPLPPPRPHRVAAPVDPHQDGPFTFGAWAALGGQWTANTAERNSAGGAYGAVGAYGEFSHLKLRPALEIRETGGILIGTVGGARVGWRSGPAIVYGEALFGPAHQNTYGTASNAPWNQINGVLSQAEFGIELLPPQHPNTGIRMAFDTGSFSALPGAHPSSFAVGLLLRIP